jgi:FAD/FMN-containing dehydrogenase
VISAPAVDDLRLRHRGPVITPADDGYDAARTTFNGMLDRRPALVARPLDVDDVVSAVTYAGEADLPVAVRGGGHSVTGHCVGDGSLVVDLRLLRDVHVDPEARTATCGGGALWEDLDPPCQRHGLATPGGTFGDTGVAGLTLGGGIGHLIGAYGLTLDNLLAATVVTADGGVVRASPSESQELFWALRGGGGNFGVVVEFTFRLHPVARFLAGFLQYDLVSMRAAIPAWRDVMERAPDNLSSFPGLFRSELRGEEGGLISVALLEDESQVGADLVEELIDLTAPVAAGLRPMFYPELQEIFGRMPFGLRHYWSGRFVRELPDELVAACVGHIAGTDLTGSMLFEPLHGAAARVPPEATAFAGREARFNVTYIGVWSDPAEDQRQIDHARAHAAALQPWTVGGGYLNYASEASADGLETEYGSERLARLRAVKRRYDPANVFRFNHNIEPAGAT